MTFLNVNSGSIKTKKSPSAYVFPNKNCFRCHAIMLFVSTSTYDHEEVFTNLLWHCHCSRKFFTTPEVISSHSQNSNFLHHFEPFWLWKWFERVWTSKNHHLLTFLQIKTVPDVVRSCCLFLQIPKIKKKCLSFYYIIVLALANFYGTQTHQRSVTKQ